MSTVSINDDIDQIKKPDNRKNKLEFNSKFIVLIGFLISGSDIANNTTFLLGSILAIIANLI